MKYLLIILSILISTSAFGADNRAIRSGALPITTGFGADNLGAYTGGNPAEVWVIDELTFNNGDDGSPESTSRNGLSVIAGCLHDALSDTTPNRVILFEVAGTIDADDDVIIMEGDNVAIYGQTAPSPGVLVKNLTLRTASVDNIIIQHIRFAGDVGEEVGEGASGMRDALMVGWSEVTDGDAFQCVKPCTGDDRGSNVIIDHVTVLWGEDENLPIENVDNVIVSNTIVAQALGQTSPLSHGTQAKDASNVLFYYNLLAHNEDRNPYVVYSSTVAITNNWIYGPDSAFPIIGQGTFYIAADANIIDAGDTSNNYFDDYWFAFKEDPGSNSKVYFVSNVNDNNPQDFEDATDYSGVRETSASVYDNEGGDDGDFEVDFGRDGGGTPYDAEDVIDDGFVAIEANATLKSNIAAFVGARPADRIITEANLVSEAVAGIGTKVTSVPSWPTVSTANNPRLLDTGMAGDDLNSIPSTVSADTDSDGRTDFMSWIDELSVFVEGGQLPEPENDYIDDANCIGHYFDQGAVGEDGQSGENDLDSGSGESEWVSVSSYDSSAIISSVPTRIYVCQAITDAGGITLSKVRIYPWNAEGSITGKDFKLYHDTQVGGVGNDLVDPGGTEIASVVATDDWNSSAVDIEISPAQAFAENELLCFRLVGADSSNYMKVRSNSDGEAKLGDYQQFEVDGTHYATINEDFRIVLYEESGDPPEYSNSIADFNGTDQYVYATITDLHANTPGITGKDDFAFVFEGIDFDTFPTDTNDFTLVYLANAYDLVIKTDGADNKLEMRVYDGSDWDAVWTHASDLATDTGYDIMFSYDSTTFTGVIDVGTTSNSTRVGSRIESVNGDSITMNDPNAGDMFVGTDDAAGEWFNGAVGAFSIWDDQLSATDFVNILTNTYGTPAPTMSALTISADSWDITDVNTYKAGTATFSEEITFSAVSWEMETGDPDLPCWLSGGTNTTSPTTSCGPLLPGMRTLGLDFKSSDLVVTGFLQDMTGEDMTDTTVPASVTGAIDIAIAGAWTIPSDHADYATLLAAASYLISNDHIQITDNANITIVDEDGTENNPIRWYFRAGYTGTFDLGSNDDITVFMHPSGMGNVANDDGTRVTVIPFNGAAGL